MILDPALTILDLTPSQLAAAEPHFWATGAMGGGSICRAVRVKGANGPFPYLAGEGKSRRLVGVADEGQEGSSLSDAHNLAVLALVRNFVK